MKTGMREKFLLPALGLILIGTISTIGVSSINFRNMMRDVTEKKISQNAASVRDYIVSWVENREQDVFLLAQQDIIRGCVQMALLGADHVSGMYAREVNDNLRIFKGAHPYYEELGIVSKAGEVIISSNIDMSSGAARLKSIVERKNLKNESYFKEALQGKMVITGVRPSDESGKPVFIISTPIEYSDDGKNYQVIGMLYAVVDLPYFTKKFVDPMKIGKQGYVTIYDRDGMIISAPDKSKIMTANVKNTDYGREMLAETEGIIEYSSGGKDWMAAFKQNKRLGWNVAAVASKDDLMAPVRRLAKWNLGVTLVILFVAIVVIVFVAALVSRPINNITESLNLVARQVLTASQQISDSSRQLAQGASSQASSIEETSASLEELASMASHNADNAEQANNLSSEAREAAKNGAEAMGRLKRAMNGINDSSKEVAKVAKGIEEIAFQTNLLALNAAVEAARAGEAGKGFAVVAEEVRNLAQRASEQAKTTSTLITDSRNRTRDGAKQADDADKVLQVILESVEKGVSLVVDISAASKEQAQGIGQINKAVSSMDQIVQQNSAGAQESASASKELTSQAFHMKSLVRNIRVLVAGTSTEFEAREDEATEGPAKSRSIVETDEERGVDSLS